ncbi:MAG: LLM class flavin-dependent oxidoreductase [Caldilineaceae bacterium]|nr:LLM class flavin-dependent oxidoreductase [Caldilineaceae bacterium]
MHPIQFGFCVPIFASPGGRLFRTANYAALDASVTMRMAQEADALGYDALWVADHLMLGQDNAILEGWTTLAALAGATRRARLGLIHQAHFFRQPALTAKMAATLDQISGGRFIFFIDAAYSAAEHHAYGLPFPADEDERMARTLEGAEIARLLWQAQEPVSYQGRYYQFEKATATPRPVQQPHPPIWFGRNHPLILAACARYGQGWNTTPVSLPELRRLLDELAMACAAAGRNIDEIERSLETQILIAPDVEGIRRQLRGMMALAPTDQYAADVMAFVSGATDELPRTLTEHYIVGTPAQVAHDLQQCIDLGVTHFMLWFMDAPAQEGLRLFAEEVAPRFRR